MTQPHEHDEDPEECIGDPVPDPWDGDDDQEVNGDGMGSSPEPR